MTGSFVKLGDVAQKMIQEKMVQKSATVKATTVQAELTQRQITLIRVALLLRCDRLKKILDDRPHNRTFIQASYDESIDLLNMLHHLRMGMRDMAIEELEAEERHK